MFRDQIDLNQYLYHYTSYTTFLEKILPTQQLRLSSFRNTNDPREKKDWGFVWSLADEDNIDNEEYNQKCFINTDKFHSVLKDKCKIICFARDNPDLDCNQIFLDSKRGFSHSRMWAQYAGNHTGVCLMFDKHKLMKVFEKGLTKKGDVYHGIVNYGTENERIMRALHVSYDELLEKGISSLASEHLKEYLNELFFEKDLDWREEWEYRWLLFSNEANDYEFINYEDALEGIYLGLDFPMVYFPLIENYCRKHDVSLHQMLWQNHFFVRTWYVKEKKITDFL
ncbi:DUF2971 domain-containing protein [Priestia flexa]|uniref:DUF2971 domain-containing protein n=1 Tax=Priestia flexa TaxID=86664 RepID=UPI0010FBF94C|nr:DUF2971 domain-containing protein [Priestia flexa]QCS52392.1 DUF2971 domain-containing protein [Priestia flexa]